VVSEILDLPGQKEVSGWPMTNEGELELDTKHTVSGNSMRFRRGNIQLRLDEEWKRSMKTSDTRLVTALTWPLLLR
jgi:hypothetical protein